MPADPGHLYRAPEEIEPRRILIVGPRKSEFITYNNFGRLQLNPSPRLPNTIPKILQIPLRRVWREETLYLLNYAEIAYYEATFAQTVENLRMLFDGIVKYNRVHGLLTFLMNSRCRCKII